MLKTPFAAPAVLAAVAASMLAGCGGGDGSSTSTVHQNTDAGSYQVESGVAQKGPLRRGSVVTVNELLSTNLAPNGKAYTFETSDDLGTFKPTSVFTSPFLETTAQGYFFNELTGDTDKDWVVLRGLSNLSTGADKAVNVNVLTSITKDRIRALVTGTPAKTFAAARQQAQRELLDALYLYNASDLFTGTTANGVTTPASFMELDLSQSRQTDQILAALSGVLTYAGQTGGGVNSLLSQIEGDLANDGLLNNSPAYATSVQTRLNAAFAKASMGLVAGNLNRFYALKSPYGRDDLAQWIDSSGGVDRVIDRNKFTTTDAAVGTETASPAYTAGGDDAGQCLSTSAGTLYRNGVKQTAPVLAAKGDLFRIGVTPFAGQTTTAFLQRHPLNALAQCGVAAPSTATRLFKYSTTGAAAATTALPASYLGANLPGLSDWEFTPVYADLVMHARQFGHPDHPWGGPTDLVPIGADGWPVGDFGVYLMSGPGRLGTYKVAFNGQANVSLAASAATTISGKVYDAAKNLTTLDVVRATGADQMVLIFKGTGSGIKNLKVMRPGYAVTNPPLFTTEFVHHISRFKTLRFMDWLRTNNNRLVTTWATRTVPTTTRTLSAAGVPWEHVIALGNQTGKDLWINIPLLADDDHVLQLARLLKTTLTSGAKVYVEYSNEIWNSSFTQYGDNKNLATAEVGANPASPLAFDGNTNADMLGYRRSAKRLKEISDIFRGVYGDAAMMATIRPVFAGQVVQPYIAQMGLEFVETVYGPPSRYFYALAGAPYFNLGARQTVDGLTAADVLAAMGDSVTALSKVNAFEKNIALARWYNLPLLAYEGGADTFGPGSLAAKKAASLDPAMLALCKRYLSTWYAGGGETMMWYTAGATNWDTQYGSWGLTNDFANTTAPKIQCMDQTLAGALPAVLGRNAVPGTVNALAWVGSEEPFGVPARNAVRYLHPGSYVSYAIVAPAGGTYALTLVTDAGAVGNKLDVSVNGQLVAPMFELVKTGWNAPTGNTPIAVTLNKGYNTVRVKTRVETSGFELTALVVK